MTARLHGVQHPWSSALVTGASSGIGEQFVRLLAAAGVPTVVVARRTDRLAALRAELGADLVEVLPADLSSVDGCDLVATRLTDDERPIDLLVNNAGFGTSGPFAGTLLARSEGEILVNVLALTRLSRAAVGEMVPRRRGWIVNVSSVAGFQPAANFAVYAATKAYVTSFTESIHDELRGSGVHVTALCPGLTRTEFIDVSGGGTRDADFPSFAWLDAGAVAQAGLTDVARNRVLSVPGITYKALVTASDLAPRSIVRRVARIVAKR